MLAVMISSANLIIMYFSFVLHTIRFNFLIYLHITNYIYIFIYTEREGGRERGGRGGERE